jgi:hypothetical protein
MDKMERRRRSDEGNKKGMQSVRLNQRTVWECSKIVTKLGWKWWCFLCVVNLTMFECEKAVDVWGGLWNFGFNKKIKIIIIIIITVLKITNPTYGLLVLRQEVLCHTSELCHKKPRHDWHYVWCHVPNYNVSSRNTLCSATANMSIQMCVYNEGKPILTINMS